MSHHPVNAATESPANKAADGSGEHRGSGQDRKPGSDVNYQELVSKLPAGIYTCDKEGRITFFNEVAVELWGYRPDIHADAVRFCACCKVWLTDGSFVPADQTPMAQALRTGKSFRNVEAVVERPDGSRFYANVNVDPLLDEQNKVIGAINIFQDITNLKETELALKESEAKYRQLIECLNTPLYTTDPEGRITSFNKAAVALWGREPVIGEDKWCGSHKIYNTYGEEIPHDACPMAVCLREGKPILGEEIVVARPDGTLRTVTPHPQPLFDSSGVLTGAVNMLVDITPLKETEAALRESEAKYRELAAALEVKVGEKARDLEKKNEELRKSEERYHKMVDEVEDYAIILLDREGIVQNWNRGAERIKGYKEGEIVGRSFEVFYLPEDRKRGLPSRLINEARLTGKAATEGWRQRKDGTRFWGSIVIAALHDEQEEVIGFTKVTRDLTERKMAEDKLREYSSELEFQNEELEQFAYAASHDMKEPLRKIHLYNSYINDHAADKLDARSRDYLSRSMGAVRRLTVLIEDLLTYSRTTSDVENFSMVDFNQIVEDVLVEHREELTQIGMRVEVDRLPVIRAISFQCKQLMDNLISNSMKYRHPDRPGSIRVTSELLPGNDGARNRAVYRISVEDNGIGFEPEYAEKIFEVFQRLDNKTGASGSGIGLAICKKIIQNHKGVIRASGRVNEGARFDMFFPVD